MYIHIWLDINIFLNVYVYKYIYPLHSYMYNSRLEFQYFNYICIVFTYIYNVYLRTLHIKLYIYLVIVFPCVAPPELLVFQVLAQLAKGTDKDCDPVAGSETQCVQPGDDVTVLGSHGLTVIDWWVIYSSSLKHRRVKSTEKMVNWCKLLYCIHLYTVY